VFHQLQWDQVVSWLPLILVFWGLNAYYVRQEVKPLKDAIARVSDEVTNVHTEVTTLNDGSTVKGSVHALRSEVGSLYDSLDDHICGSKRWARAFARWMREGQVGSMPEPDDFNWQDEK
jgi:NAD(P)H-flavin reductase